MVDKVECTRCKNSHPETLVIDDVCVYCKADDAERIDPIPDQVEQKETPPEIITGQFEISAILTV